MKKKIKKICGFFGCCVVLLFSIFSYIPQVKADDTTQLLTDPSVAYLDYEVILPSQVNYYIYVLDAYQQITTNTCQYQLYNSNNGLLYSNIGQCEFLRFASYDTGDYYAYKFSMNYTSVQIQENDCIIIALYDLKWDNTTLFDTWGVFPNVIREKNIYENAFQYGYNDGFTNGYRDGENDAFNSLVPGEQHYDTIYNAGKQAGETSQINTNFFVGIFEAFDAFFSIHLGSITIGAIILIPLSISLAWFIIKSFRGGGD